MKRVVSAAYTLLFLSLMAPVARAQAPAADSTATPAPADAGAAAAPDSAAQAAAAAAAAAKAAAPPRASWLSDRIALRVGDVLTVVVDEQTIANEHVSSVATGNRASRSDLNAGVGVDARVGPAKTFGTGVNNSSRDVGDAGRQGALTSVLSVRVTEIAPGGIAKIAGSKKVTVDGRTQEVALTGSIRTQDVDSRNRIRSESISDAEITYKGKKIAPRTGILGSILGILWP